MRATSSTQPIGNDIDSGFENDLMVDACGAEKNIAGFAAEIAGDGDIDEEGTGSAAARRLYFSLLNREQFASGANVEDMHAATRKFLCGYLEQVEAGSGRSSPADELPTDPAALPRWIARGTEKAGQQYRAYVGQRQAGAPRRYFPTRSHALNFLNAVAPTKLVDGAWLYGLTAHWNDPRLRPLLRIYLEELGDGDPRLNHVVLYRQLLDQEDCNSPELLSADHYVQGALQLALAYNADEFLPEVIGFNLGYEQLPLHLLITAYELRELDIDPYYFTLHVTIDNSHAGHARKALQGLLNLLPRGAEAEVFMRRVRRGAALNSCGTGSLQIIESFDLHTTLIRILVEKGRVGKYLHGDYCRVGGRSVTDWLQHAGNMPQFLRALEDAGWIKRGQPPEQSRFWQLLQGDKARMFGVFTAYEQQVLRDWIAGDTPAQPQLSLAQQSRILRRHPAPGAPAAALVKDLSGDLPRLRQSLARANDDGAAMMQLLRPWLAPDRHHTAAGLFATRAFSRQLG